jgi:hypothetical protein
MSRTIDLPVLDRVRIASPCSARWEDMKGNERVRHCEQCNLNVFNFSELTRQEAEELVISRQGRLCARFWRRADGTIITRDCPVGLAALRARAARTVARVAAVLGLLLTGGTLLGSRTRDPEARLSDRQPFATLIKWLDPTPRVRRGQMLMGDVCLPPPSSTPGSR